MKNGLPRLDLPDYDWEKQYKNLLEIFLMNIKKMKKIMGNSLFQK